ncbi:MAG: carbohydrate kinase [Actinomycetota bacterium]|nr:carbohydrate kinase [Actinomycetota bacterium]
MILVCGEALVDLVEVAGGSEAPMLRSLPGGSPANAAVALARLGENVALCTRLGEDACGDLVRHYLEHNGVDLSYVVAAAEPTTLALVSLSSGGDARYAFYFDATAGACWQPGDAPASSASFTAVHLGSMSLASLAGRRVLGDFVASLGEQVTISLDPNVRLSVVADVPQYRADLERLVGRADLVRVSGEDLELLYPDRPVAASGAAWASLGPRLLVVSQGAAGPLVFFGDEHFSLVSPVVEVVDTVGAGDTYSAALLHCFSRAGLLAERLAGVGRRDVDEALAYAAAAASITCERQGADPPTAAEVSARLASQAGTGS